MVLTRLGLHHFHVDAVAPDNRKGRSGHLIFAEVTESDFTLIDKFRTTRAGQACYPRPYGTVQVGVG